MSSASINALDAQISVPPAANLPPAGDDLYEFDDAVELPRKARITFYALVALLAAGLLWCSLAQVDIVVSAPGKFITQQQLTVIQPFELSVVRNLAVRVGDRVQAGQVVATLDRTYTQADVSDAESKRAASRATLDRIRAEMANRDYNPADLNQAERSQRAIFLRRRQETAARAAVTRDKVRDLENQLLAKETERQNIAEQVRASGQSVQIYHELVNHGIGSKLKLLDAERSLAEAQEKVVSNEGEQRSLKAQIETAKSELASYLGERARKLADEYAKAEVEYDEADAKLMKAKMRNTLVILKSPIDGTVLEVADRVNGSVVREAESLMTLVPKDAKLLADLRVDTRDIARLKVGQKVMLKLESLPYQQFGYLEGRLTVITPDTLADDSRSKRSGSVTAGPDSGAEKQAAFYRVQAEIVKNELRNLPDTFVLRPGMKVTGDINVGERSIVDYIFNPITRAFNDSLREP